MPGVELHADFDRDGRLTRSAQERAARLAGPGAIVIPNLDKDQRVLPASASRGQTPDADFALTTLFARDDELLPVEVRVAPGAMAPDDRLVIRLSGLSPDRVRLSTTTGSNISRRSTDPALFDLPAVPAAGVLNLLLQIGAIAGASTGRSSTLDVTFHDDGIDESHFELVLLRVDVGGRTTEEDRGRFTVASIILDDGLAAATRVYVVSLSDNRPTIIDIKAGMAGTGVELIEIPADAAGNDSWIQDQYQHGVMQAPGVSREIVLHLPRLRKDAGNGIVSANLGRFVDGHFRSQNVALHNDLWNRLVQVGTSIGTSLRISFPELSDWVKMIERVEAVFEQIGIIMFLLGSGRVTDIYAGEEECRDDEEDWLDDLRGLDETEKRIAHVTQRRLAEAEGPEQKAFVQALKLSADALIKEIRANHRLTGSAKTLVLETPVGGTRVSLAADTARKLFLRGRQMDSAANYGGNIEATPPVNGAPLGKILIGNVKFPDGGEFVDPDLLRLLAKQKKQPIVELNTAWLKVGHVDELAAIVPRGKSEFAVLHASSAAAMLLLREATFRYRGGLPELHPDRQERPRPRPTLPRLMIDGKSPVTRLFRGKTWRHEHRSPEPGKVANLHEPPLIYVRLAAALTESDTWNIHRIGYVGGADEDRRYRADITPAEILFCERAVIEELNDDDEEVRSSKSVNDAIDAHFLEPSRQTLTRELGVAVIPLPVIWDAVEDLKCFLKNFKDEKTSAFSPDPVNLVSIGKRLLIPKPYGPRMRMTDAIFVVRTTMRQLKMPGSIRERVTPQLIAKRAMKRETYWVEKADEVLLFSPIGTLLTKYGGIKHIDDVIEIFRDSFPDATAAQLQESVFKPNAQHFDKDGFLKKPVSPLVIKDDMVDIFELYIAAVAEELGADARFVDSWFYHTADGQVHCGTNVLRRPKHRLPRNAWDVPDTKFRS